jgi:membrane protein involved in colicin uptake
VGVCGHRLRISACLLFALVAVLILSSAQADGAKRQRSDCTWGASSIRAEVVDGKLVVSAPATSGCIPH